MNYPSILAKYPWTLALVPADHISPDRAVQAYLSHLPSLAYLPQEHTWTLPSILRQAPEGWMFLPEMHRRSNLHIGIDTGQAILFPDMLNEAVAGALVTKHPQLVQLLPPSLATRAVWLAAVGLDDELWGAFPLEHIRTAEEVVAKGRQARLAEWYPYLPEDVRADREVILWVSGRAANIAATHTPREAWTLDLLAEVAQKTLEVLPYLPADTLDYAGWLELVRRVPGALLLIPHKYKTLEMCRLPGAVWHAVPMIFCQGRLEIPTETATEQPSKS